MYWFNPYFAMLKLSCQKKKKGYKFKTKLTNNNWVFSIVKPILNHNSIKLSILRVRMNAKMLWLTPDIDCWMVWKKKSIWIPKTIFLLNFRILEKNIFIRGMDGLTKCWLILHFEKYQFFIKSISKQVMFLVFWFLHFLC